MKLLCILCSLTVSSLLLAQQISRDCTLNTNQNTNSNFSMGSPSNSDYEACTEEECTEVEQDCSQCTTTTEQKFSCCVPCSGNMTSGFCTKKRPDHKGLDYDIRYSSVFAAHDGIVRGCRFVNIEPEGKYIIIETQDGQYQTHYYHLSKLNASLCEKEKDDKGNLTKPKFVKQGTYLATSGDTGTSTGPHLHFSLKVCKWDRRINKNGFVPIDPTPYIIDSKKAEAVTYVPTK